jgi:dTDP-4-dehydrorhamnose 3,5-epimerase
MQVIATALDGVKLIQPKVFADSRGFFLESWNAAAFAAAGLPASFVQDNHSRSAQYTLRGLHYQVRTPQGKLVRCTSGEIYDVVVDLRPESATFGKWIAEVLSAQGHRMLWIPPGFAHGFLVLTPSAEMQYKVTTPWSPPDERVIRWDDPALGVSWPLPAGQAPVLSARDAAAPPFEAINREELAVPTDLLPAGQDA